MNESSCFLTPSPAFGVVSFWIWAILIGVQWYRIVVSSFPDDTGSGASLQTLVCRLSVFFGEGSVQAFGPFFFSSGLSRGLWDFSSLTRD